MSALASSLTSPKSTGVVTLVRDGKRKVWSVVCEPHVRMRIKRVFGKADRSQFKAIEISDTLENCRDLAWFLERYRLDLDPADRRYLDDRAGQHAERAEAVSRITADGYRPMSFDLALPPREYQRVAAELVLHSGGALIADDVGLGKTATAICVLTDPRTRPALVVTLTHLPKQWQAEIAKFAPNLRAHVIKKGTPYDLAAAMRGRRRKVAGEQVLPGIADATFPDVIICNYHKLAGWADVLPGIIKSVVFDEVQELRKSDSNKYAAAHRIAEAADIRMGLSATPIYNYGGEMHSVLSCIRPGELGTVDEFGREWGSYEGTEKIKDPRAFGAYLRAEGLMLRRTREDVGRELPELTKVPHHVDADTAALDAVEDRAAELARIILSQGGQQLERGAQMRASDEISHLLRQATGIAKAPYVAEFVRLLVESGEKVVLYGWHREVYSLWMDRLKDLNPVMYTGSESPAQKEAAKHAFTTDPACKVLVMSLRSGAGLDGLQGYCRTVVFGELDWSPGVHEQCVGRVHRDGQPDKVVAYFLISDSGSDPVVADVLGLKRQQIEGVRDPDAELIEKLDTGGGNARRLAEVYLNKRGAAPDAEVANG